MYNRSTRYATARAAPAEVMPTSRVVLVNSCYGSVLWRSCLKIDRASTSRDDYPLQSGDVVRIRSFGGPNVMRRDAFGVAGPEGFEAGLTGCTFNASSRGGGDDLDTFTIEKASGLAFDAIRDGDIIQLKHYDHRENFVCGDRFTEGGATLVPDGAMGFDEWSADRALWRVEIR